MSLFADLSQVGEADPGETEDPKVDEGYVVVTVNKSVLATTLK